MSKEQVSSEGKSLGSVEKRSVPRVNVEGVPVEIFDTDGITILGVGYIENLGINCAGLDTTINLSRNQEFFMRFLLEKKFMINTWVKVARIVTEGQKKYYGVRFTKTDILHEKDLKIYLENKINQCGGK